MPQYRLSVNERWPDYDLHIDEGKRVRGDCRVFIELTEEQFDAFKRVRTDYENWMDHLEQLEQENDRKGKPATPIG